MAKKEIKKQSKERKENKNEKKKVDTKVVKPVKKQEKVVNPKPIEKKEQIKKDKPRIGKLNDPYKIIVYPVSTEKSIRLMESENKLIFRVALKSKKSEIKRAIEDLFKAKVVNVKTLITQDGHKRAYIKFSDETPAIDIATQLGMM